MEKSNMLYDFSDDNLVVPESVELCQECGSVLPEPIWEEREGGYSEQVIECDICGALYTN